MATLQTSKKRRERNPLLFAKCSKQRRLSDGKENWREFFIIMREVTVSLKEEIEKYTKIEH